MALVCLCSEHLYDACERLRSQQAFRAHVEEWWFDEPICPSFASVATDVPVVKPPRSWRFAITMKFVCSEECTSCMVSHREHSWFALSRIDAERASIGRRPSGVRSHDKEKTEESIRPKEHHEETRWHRHAQQSCGKTT